MGVQASANALVCLKDLIGDTTIRTKGVDHEGSVKASDSGTKDADSEFRAPFWSLRGRVLVRNGRNIGIRWRLVSGVEPRVDSSRYIDTGELCSAESSFGKETERTSYAGVLQLLVDLLLVFPLRLFQYFLRIERADKVYVVGTRGRRGKYVGAHDARESSRMRG